MTVLANFEDGGPSRLRALWLALLVVPSVVASAAFACVAPLAAVAALAAVTLSRRDALSAVVALWLGNQIVGFAFLGYAWSANALAWGGVMLGSALVACLAARSARKASGLARVALALALAFGAQQILHWLATFVLGGAESSTLAIVADLGVVSVLWTAGLLAAYAAISALLGRAAAGAPAGSA